MARLVQLASRAPDAISEFGNGRQVSVGVAANDKVCGELVDIEHVVVGHILAIAKRVISFRRPSVRAIIKQLRLYVMWGNRGDGQELI